MFFISVKFTSPCFKIFHILPILADLKNICVRCWKLKEKWSQNITGEIGQEVFIGLQIGKQVLIDVNHE